VYIQGDVRTLDLSGLAATILAWRRAWAIIGEFATPSTRRGSGGCCPSDRRRGRAAAAVGQQQRRATRRTTSHLTG